MDQEDELSIESAFAGLFSNDRLEFASQRYSPQVEMLERLLQLDLEQAIVWQAWDQTRDTVEDSPVSYMIGSAGARPGCFQSAMSCGRFAAELWSPRCRLRYRRGESSIRRRS